MFSRGLITEYFNAYKFFSGIELVCFQGNKCTCTPMHTSFIKFYNIFVNGELLKIVFMGVTSYSITTGKFLKILPVKDYFS